MAIIVSVAKSRPGRINMLAKPESACFVIADISGYTSFLAGVELDHAHDIIADVMDTVVRRLRPAFRLAKFEGDAAFTASDMFPKQAVGSVVGIGGMAGAIGGMFIAKLVAYILETTGSYVPIFAIAASAYLIALLVIHLLAPRLEPARIGEV
jgi:hypothetical protein